jgi:hypothetical protein
MPATHGHITIAPAAATETYCRCGHETHLRICPQCGSADRFMFVVARGQQSPPRWTYLGAGLALEAVAIGATVWMLS